MKYVSLYLSLIGLLPSSTFALDVSFDANHEVVKGEILTFPVFFKNEHDYEIDEKLRILLPADWELIPPFSENLKLNPNDSDLCIFAVNIPSSALAGTYPIAIQSENVSIALSIRVLPHFSFCVDAIDLSQNYTVGDKVHLNLCCKNEGNSPLSIYLEVDADPVCPVAFFSESIEIAPQSSWIFPIEVETLYQSIGYQQFIFIRFFNQENGEQLFYFPYCLNVSLSTCTNDDLYQKVPSEVSLIAVGDRYTVIGAIECSGRGVIDPIRDRKLEYYFLLPTNTKEIFYNIQQSFFYNLSEPSWDIKAGDTVYHLSPLTQRFRYGRGGGAELYGETLSVGSHYTQNTYNSQLFPREICAYVEAYPTELWSLSSNYLHKDTKNFPSANITTLEMSLTPKKNLSFECEVGKCFTEHRKGHDTSAYRADFNGEFQKDIWFDIEKIYAGAAFNGYYQDVDLFSSLINFPVKNHTRVNLSYNSLRQNLRNSWFSKRISLAPRQRQWNGNLSYHFLNGLLFTLNGMFLRAKDHSIHNRYDFYQKWLGFLFSFAREGYFVNGWSSFGQQTNNLTDKKNQFLQKYYLNIGKALSTKFSATAFFEAGNINYFEARQWHNGVGGSLKYQFHPRGWCEVLSQYVKNTSPNKIKSTQIGFNFCYQFRNSSKIEGNIKYDYFYKFYPDNLLFLLSYTTYFGLPVGYKADSGICRGRIYDPLKQSCIADSMISIHDKTAICDQFGTFTISGLPSGDHPFKIPVLPENFITRDCLPTTIPIQKGRITSLSIPVVLSCSIAGEVFQFVELQELGSDGQLIEAGGLSGMMIFANRDNGKEIYRAYTDNDGHFCFPKLRPGKWRISIQNEKLPPFTQCDQDEIELDLKPGEQKTWMFNVYPIVRQILPFD